MPWLAIVLLALPAILRPARGTGIESSLRWITQSEESPALQPPEFFFEHEVKRLAKELHPKATATHPTEDDIAAERETAVCDLHDFREALEKKTIAPPDATAAELAHAAMRELIDDPEKPDAPLPTEFASEFADYHRGALAYSREEKGEATAAWKALLARPESERHYRTTWAMFMLGRLALEAEAWDEARTWFVQTRQAAAQGFADSPDLVTGSLGWEAYANLHSGRLAEAARLYLAQLAAGENSAVISLRIVLQAAFAYDEGLQAYKADFPALAGDPVMQRLGIAGAVAEMSPFRGAWSDDAKDDLTMQWLRALEAIDAKNVRDADRVAWIAYTRGQYTKAERWLARAPADSAYALWLKAKFALRAGKVDAATQLLSRAMAKIPQIPRVTAYHVEDTDIPPYDVSRGDLALLRLSRGEFLGALRLFLEGGLFSDAYYLADGVLTLDELKTFVQREAPKLPSAPSNEEEAKVWHYYYAADAEIQLRSILARRLVRAGRYAEARPWFEPEAQGNLDAYVAKLEQAKNSRASKDERSEAYWQAAQLMREYGDVLADYFDPVTMAQRSTGRMVESGPWPEITLRYGGSHRFVPPLARSERQRLKRHATPKLRRYYSLYLAADLAWHSAALMPDNDERTAVRLNAIGSWLKNRDEAAADRFYQAIERRCARTKLGQEAIKLRWFVPESETGADSSN